MARLDLLPDFALLQEKLQGGHASRMFQYVRAEPVYGLALVRNFSGVLRHAPIISPPVTRRTARRAPWTSAPSVPSIDLLLACSLSSCQ